MIEVNGLKKRFGSLEALRGVSFRLEKGEVVGFLGPNGAGKTTAMRILTGYLSASEGQCQIAGLDVSKDGIQVREKIGYLPESTPVYGDMEVVGYLTYIGRLRRMTEIPSAIREVVGTCGLKNAIGKKIAHLSKGYRQRVGLAQALLHRPEVLILDEPTVGLDPNQIGEIRELIREIGQARTVLLSTHILSEVEQTCKRVIIISEGRIVGQGTPEELMLQTQGAPIYQLRIRARQEEIEQGFQSLGVHQMDFKKTGDGISMVRVILKDKHDQSEDIFKLAVSKGWSLAELRREEASLEDVFKKLTQ